MESPVVDLGGLSALLYAGWHLCPRLSNESAKTTANVMEITFDHRDSQDRVNSNELHAKYRASDGLITPVDEDGPCIRQ
jgi:hypothetical protein